MNQGQSSETDARRVTRSARKKGKRQWWVISVSKRIASGRRVIATQPEEVVVPIVEQYGREFQPEGRPPHSYFLFKILHLLRLLSLEDLEEGRAEALERNRWIQANRKETFDGKLPEDHVIRNGGLCCCMTVAIKSFRVSCILVG